MQTSLESANMHCAFLAETCDDLTAEVERLRAAMVHVKAASDLLDKNGMKPGWGVAKDLLHTALREAE